MGLSDIEKEWAGRSSRFVKAELKRAGVGYKELAHRLSERGLHETEDSITAKLSRGTFPAPFFFVVMKAIGRETVNIADL